MIGEQAGHDVARDEAREEERERFDPRRYLVNLNGRGEYLEVKWRLLWLRRDHPDAVIETTMVAGSLQDKEAVFKAKITLPTGGSATGWKQETAGDFRDFLEKAETGAIGRALAALGYGTQFCDDHEFGVGDVPQVNVGQMRIVDAPVDLAANRGRSAPQNQTKRQEVTQRMDTHRQEVRSANGNGQTLPPEQQPATERQVKFTIAIAREVGLEGEELATWCQELYGKQAVEELNRRDCSSLIEALQRRRNEVM